MGDMLKPELYNFIKLNTPAYKKFAIDKILHDAGHDVSGLPPYHPDLNPIELVWAAMKSHVACLNIDFKFSAVLKHCDEFFNRFGSDEWKTRCEHTKKFEKEFIEGEPAVDRVVDEFVINLNQTGRDSDFLETEDEDSEGEEEDSRILGVQSVGDSIVYETNSDETYINLGG
ncbi:unnamed protein product [Acanthoscelides obtectus]|uniref:Tc1-like transposase DDE domain-containing protein n=1 Tax=Acanthoscelides obtectus TaxID=200917 RepID=A0A9P0KED9_ACAOB|nr:unnamed protein product [Acanthoscelides obtectus]CAK1651881.1 hypothetical protein AOBTE_LOCUS17516 [Acanthoscelides obtectus]